MQQDDRGGLRIHQALARKIGIAILSGEIPPGGILGGEIEQSEANHVSRTSYREAIRILVAKGLLESRPKAGTNVTPRARWNLLDPEILGWMFSSGAPDERFTRDLFELRGLIEPAAAGLAAIRRTDEQMTRMRGALAGMRDHGLSTETGRAADQQFHSTILEATGNEPLAFGGRGGDMDDLFQAVGRNCQSRPLCGAPGRVRTDRSARSCWRPRRHGAIVATGAGRYGTRGGAALIAYMAGVPGKRLQCVALPGTIFCPARNCTTAPRTS